MYRKIKLILLLSYISLAAVAAAVISPALPAIKQSLKLSNGSLEWVISIFLISYAFGQLFYGPLANILDNSGIKNRDNYLHHRHCDLPFLFVSNGLPGHTDRKVHYWLRLSIWSRMVVYSHKRNTSCKTSKNGFFIHTCIIYVGNWHCCGNWGGRDRTRSMEKLFLRTVNTRKHLTLPCEVFTSGKNKNTKPTHQKSILSLKHGCTNKRLICYH